LDLFRDAILEGRGVKTKPKSSKADKEATKKVTKTKAKAAFKKTEAKKKATKVK
jgi:hypothetical protein